MPPPFNYAKEKLPQIEQSRLKQQANDAWKVLYTDPDPKTLYRKFSPQSEWNYNVFFGYLETDEILSGLETMSNSVKAALSHMILTRYTKSPYQHIGDIFDKEKERLDTVRNLLKCQIDESPSPMPLSLNLKKRIVGAIGEAFVKFSPPTPQPAQSPD